MSAKLARMAPLALALCALAQGAALAEPRRGAAEDGGGASPGRRLLRIVLDRDDAPPSAAVSASAAAAPIEATPLSPPTLSPASPVEPGVQRDRASGSGRPAASPSPWTVDDLRTPLLPGEGWRIQVGAFWDPERAEARIAALETVAAGPGADPVRIVTPTTDRHPPLHRAQMSGFRDRAAAEAACARVVATGADCFVVPPAPLRR